MKDLPEYNDLGNPTGYMHPSDALLDALRLDSGRAVNSRGELIGILNDWFFEMATTAPDKLKFSDATGHARDLLESEWSDACTDELVEELASFIQDYQAAI